MASLKEVKGRIASVNNTRKITSAMKMVASAKLHKAQAAIESMLPYERRLHHILTDFMSNCTEVTSPFIVKREVKKVAVLVVDPAGDDAHLGQDSVQKDVAGGGAGAVVAHL